VQTLTALLLAFVGYSAMNLSQAGQKIGLARRRAHPAAGWTLWIGATLVSLLSVGIVLVALSIGTVSLVGAMAGSGLVTLAVFSHFVMKERITSSDLLGIALIIAGSVLTGLFTVPQREAPTRWVFLHVFIVSVSLAFGLAWVLARRGRRTGLIIGGFAGALAGGSILYQNAATIVANVGAVIFLPLSESLELGRLAALVNIHLILWFVTSNAGFILLQIAYGRGRAIHVIPAFNVTFIIVPVLGGVLVFSERLHALGWVGIVVIVVGTVVLTTVQSARKEPKQERA
jgi:drug/metabolite transporter (DMT)-like permease